MKYNRQYTIFHVLKGHAYRIALIQVPIRPVYNIIEFIGCVFFLPKKLILSRNYNTTFI